MSRLKIIGLTGLMGSGKSAVVRSFDMMDQIRIIHLGEYLRKQLDITNDRIEELHNQAESVKEKLKHGSLGEYFIEEIEQCKRDGKILLVDSVRTREDLNFFSNLTSNFRLVMIITPQQMRFQRIQNRGREFDPKDLQSFKVHDEWEMKFGMSILVLVADKFILNEGNLEDCYHQLCTYINQEFKQVQ